METLFFIYHIPNYIHNDGKIGKIGVSEEPKLRVRAQKYFEYEILETHTDIIKVSEREIELQTQYGYKVDTTPYWKSRELGTKETRSKGGKTGGKVPSYNLRKLTYEDAQIIRELYAKKQYNQPQLSEMYGMSQVGISYIINNKTYIEK